MLRWTRAAITCILGLSFGEEHVGIANWRRLARRAPEDNMTTGEQPEGQHAHQEAYPTLRAKALESLLVEKRLIPPGAIDVMVLAYEQDIGAYIR